jgi:hypothetical protein
MCVLYFLYFLCFFWVLFPGLGYSQTFENEQDRKEYERLIKRKPDIVSQHVRLEEYYVWDDESKDWIWMGDIPKGQVFFGKMTITPVQD